MNSILNVFQKVREKLYEYRLIGFVSSHQFYQENVTFFKNSEVTVFVVCHLKLLLFDNDHGNHMSIQIFEQLLVFLIRFFVVGNDFGVLIVPLSRKLRSVKELKLVLLSLHDLILV